MKATFDTVELREALEQVSLTCPRRYPSLALEGHLKMDIGKFKARLSSTNIERAVEVEIDCQADEPRSLILPFQKTYHFLTGQNGATTIELGEKIATITRPGLGMLLLCSLPEIRNYPPIPQPPNDMVWKRLDARWFCQQLSIVRPAVASEQSRPVLHGVCFHNGEIAAADGFRLVVVNDARLDFDLTDSQVIIPQESIDIILRLFGKQVEMEIGWEWQAQRPFVKHLFLKSGNMILVSEVIDGTFPNYVELIPKTSTCRLEFSAPLMLQRINMIGDLSGGNIVRLDFHRTEKGDSVCSISAHDGDSSSDYKMEMPSGIIGEGARIAFNLAYLRDALHIFSTCNLEVTTSSSPGKLTGDPEGVTVVLMPMFVQW